MGLIKSLILIFLFAIFPVLAAAEWRNTVPLEMEITRLENFAPGAARSEQYNALMTLARLYQLSGNTEAQLRSLERVLALFPADGRALVEQGQLFISTGEYEKAAEAAAALLSKENEYLLQGRFLLAQIEAFRSGNTRLLATLADDPDFSPYKNGIYYTIWMLSNDLSWKNRLTTEFPLSPEAQIAANAVSSSPTPLWLLYPGRDSIRLAEPQPGAPVLTVQVNPLPTAVPPPAPLAASLHGGLLQTGLFGREENARAMAERLGRAGFEPQIIPRFVNGNNFWAVTVSAGGDMNATMRRLSDAGFESFPVRGE
jgi:tetratricopeptide (TPR) repeat protein